MTILKITKAQNYQIILCCIFIFTCIFSTNAVHAGEVPRFASLSYNKVFLRVGPGQQYPVKWEYRAKGYPVEIVREFDHWRKVKDIDGYEGWVHKSQLSTQRSTLLTASEDRWLLRDDFRSARRIATIQPRAQLSINECGPEFCRVSAQGITGWIERKVLWGIYENEIIE